MAAYLIIKKKKIESCVGNFDKDILSNSTWKKNNNNKNEFT